jgi:ubiquinone/menaquinone biosynthesis C-methylase UbiE
MPDAPRSDDAFKSTDASSYDAVTEAFEKFTRRYSTPLAEHLVEWSGVGPGHQVLDIGTGTGVVAIEAARVVGKTGRVVGIDLSQGMLRHAKRRATEEGVAPWLTFHPDDAERLSYPDASFDVVLSLFALLHFPNPETALREMHRVLRPGGRVVVAIGAAPPGLTPGRVSYLLRRAPLAVQRWRGRWLVAPEFLAALVREHLPSSAAPEETHLATGKGRSAAALRGMLRTAGFAEIRTSWRGGVGVLASAEEFWELSATFSSTARKRLASASPDDVARVRSRFDERCREVLRAGGKLTYPYTAYCVSAVRR